MSEVFYRLHHRSKPWNLTPTSREFRQNDYDKVRRGVGDEAEGYSCFDNPWHLFDYITRRRWRYEDDDVVGFSGREVGRGVDGEPLVVPSGQPSRRMDWVEFADWVQTQPMGSKPYYKGGQYGATGWGSKDAYLDSVVKTYDPKMWEHLRGVKEVFIGQTPDYPGHNLPRYWYIRSKADSFETVKGGLPSEEAAREYAERHGLTVVSSLSLEAIISVAEETMVRGRLTGRTWHVPASKRSVYPEGVWGEDWKAAVKPTRDFVAKVLRENGAPDIASHIRVLQSTYGMEGTIAATDGMNSITVRDEHVDTMTLLHECAHIINRTREGEGHDQRFVQVAADLYRRYISAEAAEQFLNVVGMSSSAVKEAAEDHDTDVMICLRPSEALLKVYADMDECTESVDDLHITLYYLGEIEEDCGGEMGRERLYRGLYDFAIHSGYQGLTGTVNGFGQFLNEDENVLIALWDLPGIAEFRTRLIDYCKAHGFEPRQDNHGFTPHMSLAFGEEPFTAFPKIPDGNAEEHFVSVWIVWGEEWQEITLAG